MPPGQKVPTPGSTGAAPPALDGTGANLAGGNGGGTVIGIEQPAATGGQFGLPGGAAAAQQAPLALGGAPEEGAAAGAVPGGAVPPGVPQGAAPGGAGGQSAPQGGGQAAPPSGGN